MPTRTHAYLDHRFGLADLAPLDRILDERCPAFHEIEDYWKKADPDYDGSKFHRWRFAVAPTAETLRDGRVHLLGPGGLGLRLGEQVAVLETSARWRGFLTIPALRAVHRRAALQLASVLRSRRIVWVPQLASFAAEAARAGRASLEEVLALLRQRWGAPQPSLDALAPAVLAEAAQTPPPIHFVEPAGA